MVKEQLKTGVGDLGLVQALTQFVRVAFARFQVASLIRKCVDEEFVVKLVELLEIEREEIKVNVSWIIANIASTTNTVMQILLPLKVHVKMIQLLHKESTTVKEQCLWALANMAGECTESREELIKAGVVEQIAAILSKKCINTLVLENTTWLISNLVRNLSPHFLPKVPFDCMSSRLRNWPSTSTTYSTLTTTVCSAICCGQHFS